MPLYATRGELDIALDLLRVEMPDLVAEFTNDAEFWFAFSAHSDLIIDDASPDDLPYVRQQLNEMLADHGKPPLRESPS